MNVSWVSEPRYQREAKSKENQYRRLLNRKYKSLLLFLMLSIYIYYFSWMIFLLESWATVFPSSNLKWNSKWILTFFNGFDRNFLNYRNGIFPFPVFIAIRIFFSHWKINRRFKKKYFPHIFSPFVYKKWRCETNTISLCIKQNTATIENQNIDSVLWIYLSIQLFTCTLFLCGDKIKFQLCRMPFTRCAVRDNFELK